MSGLDLIKTFIKKPLGKALLISCAVIPPITATIILTLPKKQVEDGSNYPIEEYYGWKDNEKEKELLKQLHKELRENTEDSGVQFFTNKPCTLEDWKNTEDIEKNEKLKDCLLVKARGYSTMKLVD